jgi:hypothetical protein
MGKNGEYTRINGLPRDKCKALSLQNIENYGKGCLKKFANVLPDLHKFVDCTITVYKFDLYKVSI